MGKQAKARRRREGWGCTSKRFRPVTASVDDHNGHGGGGSTHDNGSDIDGDEDSAAGRKRKRTTLHSAAIAKAACPRTKRRLKREDRELRTFVGKQGVAAQRKAARATAAAAAGMSMDS